MFYFESCDLSSSECVTLSFCLCQDSSYIPIYGSLRPSSDEPGYRSHDRRRALVASILAPSCSLSSGDLLHHVATYTGCVCFDLNALIVCVFYVLSVD